MNIKNKKRIFWIILILWLGVIFFLSSQTGDESGVISEGMTESVVQTTDQENPVYKFVEKIIRKSGHFAEYAVLGILACLAFCCDKKSVKRYLAVFVFGTFYAMTDEIHQLYVPKRSGEVRDIFFDACGVLLGILAFVFIFKIMEKKRLTNNTKKV
ncbi:MAG: VanZ family protein [Oscillospiraceae bacterium]